MHITSLSRALIATLAVGSLWGCPPPDYQEMSKGEAESGARQAITASQASALTSESIEISTEFTLGEGVAKGAEELADFYQSQIPCAEVALDAEKAQLTIDHGTLDDDCVWRDRTWGGSHTITIARNDGEGVQVEHAWTDFTQGTVVLTGNATVTWIPGEQSREVAHDFTWKTDRSDRVGAGTHTQRLIDPDAGISGGMLIDGDSTWGWAEDGLVWSLASNGVQMRGQDAMPQAGTYILTTPVRTITMEFERVDDAVSKVTLTSGERSFSFNVGKSGELEDG
ncbi:MAG: hypothetical protein ACE366_00120 [Bradymonadia bacterium]